MKKIIFILLVLFISIAFACDKDDEETQIFNFEINPLGETQVSIDWEDISDAETIRFTIDTDSNFMNPVVVSEINTDNNSITLEGLEPVTDYVVKIEVDKSGQLLWSEIKEFTSFYTLEVVKYPSTDDSEICATLSYVSTKLNSSSRTAIFLHEFMKSKSSWGITNIKDTLIREGYLCVAFDFRGHGCSPYADNVWELLDTPWDLREDFDATLNFLETVELERSDEIVVFGASIGACVATAVSTYENVLGGVATSAVEMWSYSMANGSFAPKGMYYFAGELDVNEALGFYYEQDAISLSSYTKEPKKYYIKPNSDAHGVGILEGDTELINSAIYWIRNL
ncbi:MAG: hypothetical protein C0597_14195 [Marinilabiliales bacterium]|nr:MAG: hypothetical protein C0597_14195 [Marinilabiliales bacterium]